MVPWVGRSRPTIIFAIVVLPEPDSPTMASDPAAGTVNDTSSTATSGPNSLRRPATSSTGTPGPITSGTGPSGAGPSGTGPPLVSGIGALSRRFHGQPPAQLVRPHAAGQPAVELGHRGRGRPAAVLGPVAPGGEGAFVRRGLERRQRPAGDRVQPVRGLGDVRP